MKADGRSSAVPLIACVVICLAVAGYFTGLQSPMNPAAQSFQTADDRTLASPAGLAGGNSDDSNSDHASAPERPGNRPASAQVATDGADSWHRGVLPATHYSMMAEAMRSRTRSAHLSGLNSNIDPFAEIIITAEDKLAALRQREQNRAFNGAPPTIPHAIDQRSDTSCRICHDEGARTTSLRIPRMSHAFLPNCTQCHVESNPPHWPAVEFADNRFAGLAAPVSGPRAFTGAPPQIPHSTWMRSDCLSCHGQTGLHGIRTTHPWRSHCQQCHAPSAMMDQTLLVTEPEFLPGPTIKQ